MLGARAHAIQVYLLLRACVYQSILLEVDNLNNTTIWSEIYPIILGSVHI